MLVFATKPIHALSLGRRERALHNVQRRNGRRAIFSFPSAFPRLLPAQIQGPVRLNESLSLLFLESHTHTHTLMISRLQYKPEGPPPKRNPGELLLTSNNVRSLQDLHHFFSSLSRATCDTHVPVNNTQLETVIEQDFLEKMPAVPAR